MPDDIAGRGEVCGSSGNCPCARRGHGTPRGGEHTGAGGAGRSKQVSALNAGTLDRILASPHTMLRKLVAPPEVLAFGLIGFGTATATTRNDVCTIHQIGSYDLPTACGRALVTPSAWISLRVRPDRLGAAVIAHDEGVPGALPSLYVYADDGRLSHRVLVHSADDASLLLGLGRSRPPSAAQLANVQLSPAEEGTWREGDQLTQLDAVFGGSSAERHASLAGAGTCGAGTARDVGCGLTSRRVDCAVIPAMFEHLSSVGLPVCVGVPSSAVLQLSVGPVHLVERVGSLLVVSLGEGVVELELGAVRSCFLVTAWGPLGRTSTLELYDKRSSCVAVVTQLGLVGADVHRAWEHLVESLPAG